MRYYKITAEGLHSLDWGGDPTYWLEVCDDGDAEREIQEYPNETVVSYDRSHPEDDHGALSIMVVDGDDDWWEPHGITPEKFECRWRSHQPVNRLWHAPQGS